MVSSNLAKAIFGYLDFRIILEESSGEEHTCLFHDTKLLNLGIFLH